MDQTSQPKENKPEEHQIELSRESIRARYATLYRLWLETVKEIEESPIDYTATGGTKRMPSQYYVLATLSKQLDSMEKQCDKYGIHLDSDEDLIPRSVKQKRQK